MFRLGGKVVLALCQKIEKNSVAIYFDNFFSSLELVDLLRNQNGIVSLGTIRGNRLRNLEIILDKARIKSYHMKNGQITPIKFQ